MRQFRAVAELLKDKIICDSEKFFLLSGSLICVSSILGDNALVSGIMSYGEIQQDYHEGCPPTFAPPSI